MKSAKQKRCVIGIRGQTPDPDYPVDIWFDSLKSVANVLSKENQHLLKVIAEQQPQSMTELVPHPDKPRPEITEMDYGMIDGGLHLKLRGTIAGYVLRKWCVDCSPDHSLHGPEHRLWLKDHLALYGVESAAIAPGYSSPKLNV